MNTLNVARLVYLVIGCALAAGQFLLTNPSDMSPGLVKALTMAVFLISTVLPRIQGTTKPTIKTAPPAPPSSDPPAVSP